MFKNKGIAFKLILCILASCSVIFIAIFGYNYLISRSLIVKNIEKDAQSLTALTVSRIETVLRSVEQVPKNLSYFLEETDCNKKAVINMLHAIVSNNEGIYGSTIAFAPYVCEKDIKYFAPYFHKTDKDLEYVDLADNAYRYFEWPWYTVPKESGHAVWSEPYYDEGGGNVIMSTYSVPFYRNKSGAREFAGVVTADIYLLWLQEMVSSIKIGETGYGFLITRNGTIVTHPLEHFIMDETVFSIADAQGDIELRKLGQDMMNGESGFVPYESIVTGNKGWIAYMPVPSTGWSLGVLFPQDELMVDITKLNGVVLGLGALGFLFLLVVIAMIAGSITKPLRILARTTKEIAAGNLDFERPDIRSGDEVGRLADSFVYMRDALKKYIKELTQATAARERMESELKIAQDIQMSILPKVFPAFPARSEFDIYAMLEPAREVGGDLYDFFLIDEDHLCFIIGDVSGKGVPAALFMAVTKTLINVIAKEIGGDPAKIIETVNRELCHGNDACMFVTLFCGILNLQTGVVEYVNAGHNPVLLIRREGETAFCECEGGAILGVFEDAQYKTEKLTLSSGDMIYMYTDGVTEAFNTAREQFSEERLQQEVASCGLISARELTVTTLQKIKEFTAGAEQSDDITIVVLRYSPDGDSDIVEAWEDKVLVLKNNRSEIHKIETVLREFAKEHDISEEVLLDVNLALEEIFINIISYAYDDDNEHNITVNIVMENEQLIAKIADEGKPFNLLDRPSPDIEQPIEERPNSGMGVLLVKELMDNVEYTRINGKNLLILHKNIK